MLSCVEINNYRGFPSYRMDGLAQVNLFVGKNNSGKTALLEGIQLLVSGGDPGVLEEAAQRRGELVFASRKPERTSEVDVSHFFNGHELSPESQFSIAGDNGNRPVKVRIVAEQTRENADEPRSTSRYSGVLMKIEGGRTKERNERVFRITREGAVDLDTARRRFGVAPPTLFDDPDQVPAKFLGADSLNAGQLAPLLDEVQINQFEDQIVSALHILEKDVESVSMLSGMSPYAFYASRAGVRIGLKGIKQRIPLGSMGEGMRRMLALSASLACAPKGALFADEIDTGLHYSIMSDMWNLLVQQAVASNVQVFATTHSWDCIEGLSLFCQRRPDLIDKVAIHTIDRQLKHSVMFKGESIIRMAKHQIDPR